MSIAVAGFNVSSEFHFDMSSEYVSKRNSTMILNQHFSIAIAGLDGSYEFRFYASPKFASKRNYVVILNQTFFSIAIAGLNACYEFHFDTSFKFALKTILADFKSIFFLLPLLNLMWVPSFTLMQVPSMHQRGIQLWF